MPPAITPSPAALNTTFALELVIVLAVFVSTPYFVAVPDVLFHTHTLTIKSAVILPVPLITVARSVGVQFPFKIAWLASATGHNCPWPENGTFASLPYAGQEPGLLFATSSPYPVEPSTRVSCPT